MPEESHPHPTRILPPNFHTDHAAPRWGNGVPGRPSGCWPPIRPSHAPSFQGRWAWDTRRMRERSRTSREGAGPAGPHQPALARPAQPSARPPWAAGSFADKPSSEPKPNTFNATYGKMPGEVATKGKTSRSNFLDPSALAGALGVVSKKRKKTLVKIIGPARLPVLPWPSVDNYVNGGLKRKKQKTKPSTIRNLFREYRNTEETEG